MSKYKTSWIIIFSSLLHLMVFCSAENHIKTRLEVSDSSGLIIHIINQVRENKQQHAVEIFNRLNSDESFQKISEIVLTLFNGNVDNVKIILSFLRSLAYCNQVAAGHKNLFDAMIQTGQNPAPEILLLAGIDSVVCDPYFRQLKLDLKPYITNILAEWVPHIRSGNYSNIVTFFQKYNSGSTAHALKLSLPDLVNKAYSGNVDNLKNILSFFRDGLNCNQVSEGHKSILEAMKRYGQTRRPESLLLVGIDGDVCDQYFEQIKTDLKPYITNILAEWAPHIRSGNYSNIVTFFQKYNSGSTAHALKLSLPELLNAVYSGNVNNLKNIVSFLLDLPKCNLVSERDRYDSLLAAVIRNRQTQSTLWLPGTDGFTCDLYFHRLDL